MGNRRLSTLAAAIRLRQTHRARRPRAECSSTRATQVWPVHAPGQDPSATDALDAHTRRASRAPGERDDARAMQSPDSAQLESLRALRLQARLQSGQGQRREARHNAGVRTTATWIAAENGIFIEFYLLHGGDLNSVLILLTLPHLRAHLAVLVIGHSIRAVSVQIVNADFTEP